MDWQPIETAPKDGTVLLCHAPEGIEGRYYAAAGEFEWGAGNVFVMQWRRGQWITPEVTVETFGGSELTGTWTETESCPVSPTHWMPLPEPPR